MPTPILYTIQTADKKFETQTRPVLITCNDWNDYVCKYGTGNGFAQRLLCEYLGAQFMRIWELPIPEFAFIKINPEHIPAKFSIPHHNFNQTGFGLRYSKTYAELTQLNEISIVPEFKSRDFKETFLKIALFDCWLSNDDRNNNNFNLMLDTLSKNSLVAIDHEGIFNTRCFNKPIYALTSDDSLLSSVFAQKLYSKKYLTNGIIRRLEKYFYLCTESCEQNINNILTEVPDDWQIDKEAVNTKMKEIFSKEWKKEAFSTLQSFVQILANS